MPHKMYFKNSESKSNSDEDLLLSKEEIGTDFAYRHEIVWIHVLFVVVMHVLGVYGLVIFIGKMFYNYKIVLWFTLVYFVKTIAIVAGAHRLFSHRSYTATPILQALLLAGFTMAGQKSLLVWVRDHRLHHRFSDSDADPHNSRRGFFFSHIGWLMVKRHPYVIERGRKIDITDLKANRMIMFQYRYFLEVFLVFGVGIPVTSYAYFCDETWMNAILCGGFFRHLFIMHLTLLINSLVHYYGTRPYDKTMLAVESWLASLCTLGEGHHNYHHVFPWDYRASELGVPLAFATSFIELMEKIGLAYNLKSADVDMVKRRILRTGDGTHRYHNFFKN